uniref:Uncharacterized protein n=1 Tax=Myoviridae sp. ctLYR7 TaxID=2827679 RepID=A0A8S5RXB0_9CAUD|nr:MAG TPA: hypothetical protein [Myoviridae sp. ctLYR7]
MACDFKRFNSQYFFAPIGLCRFGKSFLQVFRKFFGESIKSFGRYLHIAQFFKLLYTFFSADNASFNKKLNQFVVFHAYSPKGDKNKILNHYLNCLAFIQAA